ncbi:DUF4157 domain-containing protein [Streptomyces sp. NBC_01538]|uniref:eCIS core domain-containing protein n=1 Tax=Streptomyces sp. NBC_01538 TaxID=2903897 RepID=UPI003869BA24
MHDHGQEPKARADARGPVRDGRTAGSQTAAQAQAERTGGTLTPQSVLALQHGIGNAEIGRLLELQRHTDNGGCCGGPEPEDRHSGNAPIQRSTVHDVLRSPGKPLPEALRSEMEARMGATFRDVVIHDNAAAARSAVEVNADAYTANKNHIVVGPRGLNKRTLAHELTHVEQQRAGAVAGTDNGSGLRVSDPSDRFERAAEANAARVMAGSIKAPEARQAPQARQADEEAKAPASSRPAVQRVGTKGKGKTKALLDERKAARKGRRERKERLGLASLGRTFKASGVQSLQNNTFAGMWTPTITVSGARSFKSSPDEQVLRHLSIQFFWYAKNHLDQKQEQEFQCMYVNGGIVVASNDDSSVTAIYNDLLQKLEDYVTADEESDGGTPPRYPLQEILETDQNPGDRRAAGVASKFTDVNDDSHPRPVRPGAEEMLYAIQANKETNPIVWADSNGIGGLINDARRMTGKIVFLAGGEHHAEQKLVLALYNSGAKHSAWIAGKKRPCMGCHQLLTYARDDLGMNISFQGRPGGYWATARTGLVELGRISGHTDDRMLKRLADRLHSANSYQTHKIRTGEKRNAKATLTGQVPNLNRENETNYGSASDSEPSSSAAVTGSSSRTRKRKRSHSGSDADSDSE